VVVTRSHHCGEKSSTYSSTAGMKSGASGFSDDDEEIATALMVHHHNCSSFLNHTTRTKPDPNIRSPRTPGNHD
jgi:hypothetical protein